METWNNLSYQLSWRPGFELVVNTPCLLQKATKKGDPSDKRYNESGNSAPLYQRNILERDENNRQSINQTFQSGGPIQ